MTSGFEPGVERDPGTLAPGPFGELSSLERERLQRARRLLSRPDGVPGLNRLAELAGRLVGAQSSQVSVVGESQVVMGGSGVSAVGVGMYTSVEESVCAVAVSHGGPLVITDASVDDRVRHLDAVRAGVVGAYLGVPLVSDGYLVGTLCVFTPEPRQWS